MSCDTQKTNKNRKVLTVSLGSMCESRKRYGLFGDDMVALLKLKKVCPGEVPARDVLERFSTGFCREGWDGEEEKAASEQSSV